MHLCEALPLVEHIEDALQGDIETEIDEIRVAAHLLCTLCEAGLWPHEDLEGLRSLAALKLEAALIAGVFHNPELITAVRNELARLQRLLTTDRTTQ